MLRNLLSTDGLTTVTAAKFTIAAILAANPKLQDVVTNDRMTPSQRLLAQASEVLLSWGIDDDVDTQIEGVLLSTIIDDLNQELTDDDDDDDVIEEALVCDACGDIRECVHSA